MMTYNDQAKARFPLSLDGRGARGEGAFRCAKIALAALFLAAPNVALADNECVPVGVDPSANLGLADSYDCDASSNSNDYPDGVTYNADGDLTVNFTGGGVSEVLDAGVDLGGINLSATGTDSIIFDSLTTEIESEAVTGALLNVTTVNGDIDIDTEEMDADGQTPDGVTHAIFAESTGTGSIDIATTGTVDAASDTNPADSIGIEALTDSGSIGITTNSTVLGNEGHVRAVSASGNITIETNGTVGTHGVDVLQYGILAETGGAGTLSITAADAVQVGNGGSGTAIDATTGTGLLHIDLVTTGSSNSINGSDGIGIRTNAGGDALIEVGVGRDVSAFGGIAMDLAAAGETTLNNAGQIRTGISASPSTLAVRATGDTFVLNNIGGAGDAEGLIVGPIDFSGLTDGYVFNNTANAVWNVGTGSVTNNLSTKPRISTLGAGTFNNAGTIRFGLNREVIFAEGTTFNATGDSLLIMPAQLNTEGQTRCTDARVAGCLDLTGGETTGQTEILITTAAPPLDPEANLTNAANPGILLVDVGGGNTAADHFVLHPDSENYLDTSVYGGVITTDGPLVYTLLYNPDNQQHLLSSVPTEEGAEYATFIDETLSIWHTTADAVVGRQADLRGGAIGGGWARLVSERTTRDASLAMTTHGNDFTFDMGYEQNTRAALFGFDALYGDNYVIGLHGGLISSETDYDGTGNGNKAKGVAAGLYGGWWQGIGLGELTVDAAVNGNLLTLDHDASYEVTHSDVRTFGLRAEAGWRYSIIDGFYVQPLAMVAYVQGDIEKMELRQNEISFEDNESQRTGLGLRLGGEFDAASGVTARYWLTGRAWEESAAEDGRVEYATTGEPLVIGDDISGSFEEVGFGASLSNQEDSLSVYASGGTKFIDDATNYNVTVGLRKRW